MTPFDLLFIACFVSAVVALVTATVLAARGQGHRAAVIVRRVVVGAAAYFAVLVLVSLVKPQRVVSVGDDQCSDDWCIAVTGVHPALSAGVGAASYTVAFRITSIAKRVVQRERNVVVYLYDDRGRRYDPVAGAAAPFDTAIAPGEVIPATRQFALPAAARPVSIVVTRDLLFPSCCIIDYDESFFHKKTLVRLGS